MPLQQQLERALEDLVQLDEILGAALISRDGLCVKAAGRPEMHRETFSAMTATLMGAAEIALGEFDGGKTRSIVAATDKVRMILVGATRDMLLVVTLATDASVDAMLPKIQKAATDIAATVGG